MSYPNGIIGEVNQDALSEYDKMIGKVKMDVDADKAELQNAPGIVGTIRRSLHNLNRGLRTVKRAVGTVVNRFSKPPVKSMTRPMTMKMYKHLNNMPSDAQRLVASFIENDESGYNVRRAIGNYDNPTLNDAFLFIVSTILAHIRKKIFDKVSLLTILHKTINESFPNGLIFCGTFRDCSTLYGIRNSSRFLEGSDYRPVEASELYRHGTMLNEILDKFTLYRKKLPGELLLEKPLIQPLIEPVQITPGEQSVDHLFLHEFHDFSPQLTPIFKKSIEQYESLEDFVFNQLDQFVINHKGMVNKHENLTKDSLITQILCFIMLDSNERQFILSKLPPLISPPPPYYEQAPSLPPPPPQPRKKILKSSKTQSHKVKTRSATGR